MSIGRRNRVTDMTRTVQDESSPIRQIFGGQLHTKVAAQGADGKNTVPSVTIEPFLSLNLDLRSSAVHTVEDALSAFVQPEALEGFLRKGKQVSASRQAALHRLPRVLVLAFKRFTFDEKGPHKVSKPIRFQEQLTLRSPFLTANWTFSGAAGVAAGRPPPKYNLLAVVSHHGSSLSGGHYTCDIRSAADDGWRHCDDSQVHKVPVSEVLKRQAYVLFYKLEG